MSEKKPPTPVPADKPLSALERCFVAEYLKDLNAKRAATDAGYSARTAASQGQRLLKKPNVAAAIEKALAERSKRARVKADRVIQELEDLALVDIGDIIDFSDQTPRMKAANAIPEQARRAISSVKVKRYPHKKNPELDVEIIEFKLCDKVGSLTTLMRHHGLLVDRVKVEDMSPEEREAAVLELLRKARERQRAAEAIES